MRLLQQAGVGVEQLVKQLAHTLGGFDVGVRLGDVLGLLHASPWQEECEVVVDLADREADSLARLGVVRDEFVVVGDDDEACAEAHHIWRGPQLLKHSERVTRRLLEVEDFLLRNLRLGVGGDVQISVA